MEMRNIEEYSKTWRRLINDIKKDAQTFDDLKERKIDDIVDDMERDVEEHIRRIADIVRS